MTISVEKSKLEKMFEPLLQKLEETPKKAPKATESKKTVPKETEPEPSEVEGSGTMVLKADEEPEYLFILL